MLDRQKCCLAVVDVQDKLIGLMHEKEALLKNIAMLIKGAEILSIPIIWCQQYPKGLGETVSEIAELMEDVEPLDKMSFSCAGDEKFNSKLSELKKDTVILCGIEAHVCIYQTAMDLLDKDYQVELITDAISSRRVENKRLAIKRLRAEGVNISGSEMVLFELLRVAGGEEFKQIGRLVK